MKSTVTILLGALLAAGCNNKPGGFGIDVEARTNMLPSPTKNAIVTARLLVSGAESFMRDIPGVAKAAQSGSFKFRYVPGVRSGTITLRVDGIDGSGATIAGGTAPPVDLIDGKAVDAVLTLAINGNGVVCAADTDCISGHCVDGVCCDTTCDGVCESCNLPGAVGACSPAPSGSDPDNDCVAHAPPAPGDGGVDDGGTSSVPPTGDNVAACGGTCDGNRACAFAPSTTSCGSNLCILSDTVGSFTCDGSGGCVENDTKCTDFNCNGGACRTMCSSDSDCQPTDFCNLNINKCVPKHDNGATCTLGDECKSTFCYSGVCCNTQCGETGQTCNQAGSVGKCQCQGVTCAPGVACQIFFRDADTDGFGDKTGTLANTRAVAGCQGTTPPSGFVADNTDCDDGDGQAFPGQTLFFGSTSAGVHTFDYNCDGVLEKGVTEAVGSSCQFCSAVNNVCTQSSSCVSTGQSSRLSCFGVLLFGNLICKISGTGAYFNTVACGQTATFTTCGTCSGVGGGPNNTTSMVQQTCH
ncbi:MAG: hypothetical protein ACXVDD_13970 [Polyangia bacterium]